jgi:hypothetical protein
VVDLDAALGEQLLDVAIRPRLDGTIVTVSQLPMQAAWWARKRASSAPTRGRRRRRTLGGPSLWSRSSACVGLMGTYSGKGTTRVMGRLTWLVVRAQLWHLASPGLGAPWQRSQTPAAAGGTGAKLCRYGSVNFSTAAILAIRRS